ncbi:NlpC/P60 family protein [Elioraea sp.]|uniref:NlpC/P60 family protein n=1 Tax=Elioraea sp. TaxID=2185103 RepID=UPI0025BC2F0B|nr:NlpC/P60 family protein [Elioraea sp.]
MVPAWAAEYVGLPFAECGRDRSGCDCWGLVRLVLAEVFDAEVPSYLGGYAHTADRQAVAATVARALPDWTPVLGVPERAGDVALFRLMGQPTHVGLVVAPGWMLHVERGTNSALDRLDGMRWASRRIGLYRHWDLA